NHVHPNILARNRQEYEQGHRIFEKWAEDVHRMGGSISAEHGAGKIKRRLALTMYGPERMRQLRTLKRTFDPQGILGPGNIFPPEIRKEENRHEDPCLRETSARLQ
ncbi:MAG: FAD-linked oxidase C-terminal domain-containing protein, partial [Eubacteriales bacterium]